MKAHKKVVIAAWIIFMTILTMHCSNTEYIAKDRTEIVKKLVNLVNSNDVLRNEIQIALQQQPEGSFWHNKTIEYMYDFFDEWLVFLPIPSNVRKYMDAFHDLANSEEGRAFVAKEPFRGWLYEFILARGQFMDNEESAKILPWWLSDPVINMDDFIIPEGGFKSFNEFFTRNIKPGVRPIDSKDDNTVFTSPADCTILNIADSMTSETRINVKGDSLNIHELLGGDALAGVFINGKAVLCMLDAPNYHHFHSPVQGRIVSEEQLAGLYFGMTGDWIQYFF